MMKKYIESEGRRTKMYESSPELPYIVEQHMYSAT